MFELVPFNQHPVPYTRSSKQGQRNLISMLLLLLLLMFNHLLLLTGSVAKFKMLPFNCPDLFLESLQGLLFLQLIAGSQNAGIFNWSVHHCQSCISTICASTNLGSSTYSKDLVFVSGAHIFNYLQRFIGDDFNYWKQDDNSEFSSSWRKLWICCLYKQDRDLPIN